METDLFGLVMTGGGARGAYQAGVLKRISELYEGRRSPFSVIAGASAGAINGILSAATVDDPYQGAKLLTNLWSDLEPKSIFRTDPSALTGKAARWLTDLSMGGMFGGGKATSLLDARPLYALLKENIPFERIQTNVASGALRAVAIVATNYSSGKSFTFVQGRSDLKMWMKTRRVTLPTVIGAEHILASSAIPVLFQPVRLHTKVGSAFFGDGCLRLTSPLSPAIRLGANKLVAIGVKMKKVEPVVHMAGIGLSEESHSAAEQQQYDALQPPPLAQVMGVILNAIFLDHLDTDVEHLLRINQMLKSEDITRTNGDEGLRQLDVLSLTPSVDLGALAKDHAKRIPRLLRYLLKGLGTEISETSDLLSYLLFTPEYTRELIALGYKDANARIDEIETYLSVRK